MTHGHQVNTFVQIGWFCQRTVITNFTINTNNYYTFSSINPLFLKNGRYTREVIGLLFINFFLVTYFFLKLTLSPLLLLGKLNIILDCFYWHSYLTSLLFSPFNYSGNFFQNWEFSFLHCASVSKLRKITLMWQSLATSPVILTGLYPSFAFSTSFPLYIHLFHSRAISFLSFCSTFSSFLFQFHFFPFYF